MGCTGKRVLWLCLALAALALIMLALFANGVLWFTRPAASRYAVRGVDVSSFQGEIDWPVLVDQDVDFAFIKATEGSGYVDERFFANWQGAVETGIPVGAYHFFSYDSPGETQAENFIAAVPRLAGGLPPVVDVEFYGDYGKNPPSREHVRALLTPMLTRLEQHYGAKPVLYATQRAYSLFLEGEYEDYPLWLRNVYYKPRGVEWTFWQYSDKERLKGYLGKETYIDCNVFYGTMEELQGLLQKG